MSSINTLKVLSFNAAILDIRILGRSFHRPLDFIEQRLPALANALAHSGADIICLQEMFHRNKQDSLCRLLAGHYPCVAGLARRGWKLRLGNELLVLSRYPLDGGRLVRFDTASAEELRHTSRGFYHVQVSLPGYGSLNLINFHMSAGGIHLHPEDSVMEAIRHRQVLQLTEYCRHLKGVILAGDLNAGPHTSIAIYQQLLSAGYHDLFAAAAADGISWDPDNPLVRIGDEPHLPAQRIDHVFTDPSLFGRLQKIEAEIRFRDHVVDTSAGAVPLSDHYGVYVDMTW